MLQVSSDNSELDIFFVRHPTIVQIVALVSLPLLAVEQHHQHPSMICLYLTPDKVIVFRVGRVWLYAYHHLMLVVYSRCLFIQSSESPLALALVQLSNPA